MTLKQRMTPKQWRASQCLTQADMASALGITGVNPSMTWQKWESGKIQPPLHVIVAVEHMSCGAVDIHSWIAVKAGRP